MAETVLKIEHLAKRFEGLVAVNDLNIEVERGTIHSLIGPNGSGKSTTINMINGSFAPTEGSIFFNGENIVGKPVYEIARLGIGRTYQNLKVYPTLTVMENLMAGGDYMAKQNIFGFLFDIKNANREERMIREKAEQVLEYTGLTSLKDEIVKGLPYGRQKLVELGRALMLNPKLLLLDEPAAGLNPTERAEFIDTLLKVHNDGVDLFLIEHNMDVVMNISNKITVINFGAKIAEGKPNEIQENPEVIKAYLGDRYRKTKKVD